MARVGNALPYPLSMISARLQVVLSYVHDSANHVSQEAQYNAVALHQCSLHTLSLHLIACEVRLRLDLRRR